MNNRHNHPVGSVLSEQVRWKHPLITNSAIDQTRMVIADAPVGESSFSFIVIGDTDAGAKARKGKSAASFSEAFAEQLLAHMGDSRFLLHTGDITYPTGSYQNYLSGFLFPYRQLFSHLPKSPAYGEADIVSKLPLLPVPGNHDYARPVRNTRYGYRLWRFVCDRLRETLNIDLGCYGGEGGEAYGKTFLDNLAALTPEQLKQHLAAHYSATGGSATGDGTHSDKEKETSSCLHYQAGQFTRLPNRYYTFRYGGVDFFALDSNTWNTASEAVGFDFEQLDWLEEVLVRSWTAADVTHRIVYLHHSPYTTESSRWQQSETLWVRRHLRATLARVKERLGRSQKDLAVTPLLDLVISGHAHCLEHLKTSGNKQADTYIDWLVCGGSGIDVRSQRKADTADILETLCLDGRRYLEIVASSVLYAGIKRRGHQRKHFHSFVRIDVQPQKAQKLRVVPFIVSSDGEAGAGRLKTQQLQPLEIRENLKARNIA